MCRFCPCLLAEKVLYIKTKRKKTNEIKAIWEKKKKRTCSRVPKERKHRVAGKISLGGNNRELWKKKNQV